MANDSKTTDVKSWQRKLGGLLVDGDFGPQTGRRSDEVYALAYPDDSVADTDPAGPVDVTDQCNWRFSDRSERQLSTVHLDLQRVARAALLRSELDFAVTEGVRSIDTQIRNFANGASKTYNSRHLHALAIDVMAYVDGKTSWKSWPYERIAKVMFSAASELGVPLRWGGDWDRDGNWREKGEFDLVHFELYRGEYPDDPKVLTALRDRGLI